MSTSSLFVRLVVSPASEAIEFYATALGAEEVVRYEQADGTISHCELRLGGQIVSVTDADGALNVSPSELGGSPVLLTLVVTDADAVGRRMEANGAKVVIPIDDRYYGMREGRLQDPFGHLWIISQHLEHLSPEEIAQRGSHTPPGE